MYYTRCVLVFHSCIYYTMCGVLVKTIPKPNVEHETCLRGRVNGRGLQDMCSLMYDALVSRTILHTTPTVTSKYCAPLKNNTYYFSHRITTIRYSAASAILQLGIFAVCDGHCRMSSVWSLKRIQAQTIV